MSILSSIVNETWGILDVSAQSKLLQAVDKAGKASGVQAAAQKYLVQPAYKAGQAVGESSSVARQTAKVLTQGATYMGVTNPAQAGAFLGTLGGGEAKAAAQLAAKGGATVGILSGLSKLLKAAPKLTSSATKVAKTAAKTAPELTKVAKSAASVKAAAKAAEAARLASQAAKAAKAAEAAKAAKTASAARVAASKAATAAKVADAATAAKKLDTLAALRTSAAKTMARMADTPTIKALQTTPKTLVRYTDEAVKYADEATAFATKYTDEAVALAGRYTDEAIAAASKLSKPAAELMAPTVSNLKGITKIGVAAVGLGAGAVGALTLADALAAGKEKKSQEDQFEESVETGATDIPTDFNWGSESWSPYSGSLWDDWGTDVGVPGEYYDGGAYSYFRPDSSVEDTGIGWVDELLAGGGAIAYDGEEPVGVLDAQGQFYGLSASETEKIKKAYGKDYLGTAAVAAVAIAAGAVLIFDIGGLRTRLSSGSSGSHGRYRKYW